MPLLAARGAFIAEWKVQTLVTPLSIIFVTGAPKVPAVVDLELRERLRDVTRVAEALDKTGAQWKSMVEAGAVIDVGLWRFHYRIQQAGPGRIAAVLVQHVTLLGDPPDEEPLSRR